MHHEIEDSADDIGPSWAAMLISVISVCTLLTLFVIGMVVV